MHACSRQTYIIPVTWEKTGKRQLKLNKTFDVWTQEIIIQKGESTLNLESIGVT